MYKAVLCLIIAMGFAVLAKNSTDVIHDHLFISLAIMSGAISYKMLNPKRRAAN